MMNLLRNTIIISMSALLFASCGSNELPKEEARPYPVVEVESKDVMDYNTYPTSIQGINNSEVHAKIPGYIKEVLVDEGQYVKKGQVMFRLETNALSQNASAARSGVAAAQSGISAAQARVEVAQVEVDRLKPLVDKNIISPVPLETAKANLLLAESQLAQANSAYHQANANYKSVAADVDYSVIRAPIDGVVGKINLRAGSLVGPSDQTPITIVSEVSELYAYFSMNEAEYLNFLHDMEGNSLSEKLKNIPLVELEMANGKIYGEKGKISAVTGQINTQTGSMQFRVSFSNNNGILTNGNSGKIRIPTLHKDALIMPETGTFEQQGKVYAFKVMNDTVQSVEIKVIDKINNLILIESGLQKGDIVVATGVGNLKSNTAINPQSTVTDSIINSIQPIF